MSPRQRSIIEIFVPIALAIGSMGASAYVGYNSNDKAIEHRLSVVEQRQTDDKEILLDVHEKVDKIYDKVAGW